MHDLYEFPADFADDDEPPRATLRWTASVIVLSTIGLALLNPSAIDGWVGDLPPTPTTERLAVVTGAWADAANHIGLGASHAGMHAAWKAAERADWSGRGQVEMADASNPKS